MKYLMKPTEKGRILETFKLSDMTEIEELNDFYDSIDEDVIFHFNRQKYFDKVKPEYLNYPTIWKDNNFRIYKCISGLDRGICLGTALALIRKVGRLGTGKHSLLDMALKYHYMYKQRIGSYKYTASKGLKPYWNTLEAKLCSLGFDSEVLLDKAINNKTDLAIGFYGFFPTKFMLCQPNTGFIFNFHKISEKNMKKIGHTIAIIKKGTRDYIIYNTLENPCSFYDIFESDHPDAKWFDVLFMDLFSDKFLIQRMKNAGFGVSEQNLSGLEVSLYEIKPKYV